VIVKTFGNQQVPSNKIGIIKGIVWDDFVVRFLSYSKMSGETFGPSKELSVGSLGRTPNELHVLAGSYLIKITCTDGNLRTFFEENITVKGGQSIHITCKWVSGETWLKRGHFNVFIDELKTPIEV
jgi:hypothetical protein